MWGLLLLVLLAGCHRSEGGYDADLEACLATCDTPECEQWCRNCDESAYACVDNWKRRTH